MGVSMNTFRVQDILGFKVLFLLFPTIFQKRHALLRVLFLPLVCMVLAKLGFYWIQVAGGFRGTIFYYSVKNIFLGAIYCYIAFLCHRLILLGTDSVPRFGFQKWNRQNTQFFLTILNIILHFFVTLILTIFAYLLVKVVLFFVGFPDLGGSTSSAQFIRILLFLPAVYVAARLVLSLPAIALGEKQGLLSCSWRHSWQYGIQLVVLLYLVPYLIAYSSQCTAQFCSSVVVEIFLWLLYLFVYVLEIVILSLVYHFLHKTSNEENITSKNIFKTLPSRKTRLTILIAVSVVLVPVVFMKFPGEIHVVNFN